jgi:hypothetical protein
MVVETAREVQNLGSEILGYLGIIGVSPSTFGFWARESAAGRMVDPPPRPPTQEELKLWAEIRMKMRDLAHRRHYTFGLTPLWAEYRQKVSRERFRQMAREVRAEVNRQKRKNLLRYEFTHPDVAHSLDFVQLPQGAQYPGRRYMIRILDDCTRCTLWKAITEHKGMYVGAAAVRKHFETGCVPLVFKFDLEFGHAEFERLLLAHQVVPLPNPPSYPQANGKNERANGDVQRWLKAFGPDQDWTTEELQKELNFCFTELDELTERDMFGGATRRKAYDSMERAKVDRAAFLRDATDFRRHLLMRPENQLAPMQAWRVAAKEMLKKYGLVRYSGPSEVSTIFPA